MNKDQIIAELFFEFRIAKRLLQIDHPICGCGKPSVGCVVIDVGLKKVVDARCEEHWPTTHNPASWRTRWNYMEETSSIVPEGEQHAETDNHGLYK